MSPSELPARQARFVCARTCAPLDVFTVCVCSVCSVYVIQHKTGAFFLFVCVCMCVHVWVYVGSTAKSERVFFQCVDLNMNELVKLIAFFS